MTDIISTIKLQQKPPHNNSRRVCLQQNRSTVSLVQQRDVNKNQQVSSAFLLSNTDNITSINNLCVQSSIAPLSSFLTSTQHVLLKSSLKSQKSNTTPGTATNTSTTITTATKSVRFNMPLTRILHFYTPPPIDEDGEDDSDDDFEEDEEAEEKECELEDAFLELFSKGLATSSPPSPDFASNLFHPAIQQHILDSSSNKLNLVLLNWPSERPARRIIQMVSLENLSWENARSIKGRVLVCNLAFEKQVTIRVSFDFWKTWIDIDATYTESPKGDALDLFTFELKPSDKININSQCSLAVRYQVNGREFWDNNNGNNFNLHWATSSCGDSKIGEQEEKIAINVNSTIASGDQQIILLSQQGQSATRTISAIGYQEEMKNKKKEESNVPLSKIQSNVNFYINATPCEINQGNNLDNRLFPTPTTQQQISTHFQLYLERKRRSEERQQNQHTQLVMADSAVVPMTPSPTQIMPSSRNELLLLI
jgi:hypothetical protein